MTYKEKIPSDRAFGIFAMAICAFASFYSLIHTKVFVGGASILATLSLLVLVIRAPHVLNRLNLLWFKFGMALNKVAGFFILSVMFFGIITPLALFLRICARDALNMRVKNAKSYWQSPTISIRPKDYFFRQF